MLVYLMQSTLDGKIPYAVIDIHETKGRKQNAPKLLMKYLDEAGIHYTIQSLPIGDILFPKGIVIERKTFMDLINTLKGSDTGVLRLEEQLENMIREYPNPILLIEDALSVRKSPLEKCVYVIVKKIPRGKNVYMTIERKIMFNPNSYEGLLERIREMGVRVIETYDARHAGLLLFNLVKSLVTDLDDFELNKFFFKEAKESVPRIRGRPKIHTIADKQEFFMAGLPLVNKKRAELILQKFGNPYNAITNIDSWETIPTIGKKITKEVKKILFSEYKKDVQAKEESPSDK